MTDSPAYERGQDPVSDAFTDLRTAHRGGHVCTDHSWWNTAVRPDQPCPVLADLQTIADEVDRLRTQVRAASYHDGAAEHVAEAMTGLTLSEVIDPEERAGWVLTARRAITGLADWIDAAPEREERARAAALRLAARSYP